MLLDTNFLLRVLEPRKGKHNLKARERIRSLRTEQTTVELKAATVLEVVYVLESEKAGYAWSRSDIRAAVQAILEEPAFSVQDRIALADAVGFYEQSRIDFHDCYLAAEANHSDTTVLSFDRDFVTLGVATVP